MSNKERASELLIPNREWCKHHHKGEGGDPCGFCEFNAESGAERLADAGLLAPDLPEPTVYKDGAEVEWDTPRGYVNVENGVIEVAYRHHAAPSVAANTLIVDDRDAARGIGYALLAAANAAEVEQ